MFTLSSLDTTIRNSIPNDQGVTAVQKGPGFTVNNKFSNAKQSFPSQGIHIITTRQTIYNQF